MTIDDTKTVITPEQVAITYRLAGIGTRFAAMLADTLAQAALGAALVGLVLLLFPAVGRVSGVVEKGGPWLAAVLVMVGFAVLWGYFIFFEAVWSGRTPGKKLAGIRVVRDTGHPVDFRAAFLRNVCRYVDFLPAAYGVGATVMFLSKDSKRLGDHVAGTVVVVDAPGQAREPVQEAGAPAEYRLLGDPSLLNLRAITGDQLTVVDRFLERRETLLGDARRELARTIGAPLMSVLGLRSPNGDYPYEEFLEEVAAVCRRRALG
jgi:uncharacterized RDD family membrane protein YckC